MLVLVFVLPFGAATTMKCAPGPLRVHPTNPRCFTEGGFDRSTRSSRMNERSAILFAVLGLNIRATLRVNSLDMISLV